MKWKDEIIEALKGLGGEATLPELYAEIEIRDNKTLTDAFESTVRNVIYSKSSDSERFKSGEDLFYAVFEKGEGRWGLRDYNPTKENIDLTEEDSSFPEGKRNLRLHIYRERNSKLIRTVKEQFKKTNGELYCEICKFNYTKKYGELGEDYIEAHHTVPVSELEEGSKTNLEDIVLVCANCHRMLHRKRPWLSKKDLQEILQSK
ncbi:HNH endonuclease [Bacillus mexicanus]|uniref:HNH endonuclease n=1 Tax=Bacillus mexicanus TaxID=2834415 RepID=UPI003D1B994D